MDKKETLEKMESELGPEYIVFEANEMKKVQFTGWPEKGQFASDSGKIVESWYYPVIEDGEDKILAVSSKRLQRLLFPLLKGDLLVGKTYDITAIGEGMTRKWGVKPVG